MLDPAYFDLCFDDTPDSLKVPPHSIESEHSVLGAVIRDNSKWSSIAEIVTEEDFYRPEHRTIFTFIKKLCDDKQPCDIVTLAEKLEREGKLNSIGGHAYLGILARNTPDVENIRTYAHIVKERAQKRLLIQLGRKISESAFNPQTEISEIAVKAIEQFQRLDKQSKPKTKPIPMNEFQDLVLPKPVAMLNPWLLTQSQNLVFAEAGVGKTFFTTDIAFAVATGGKYLKWDANQERFNVLLVDSEMPRVMLQDRYRILCDRNYVNPPDNFHILSFEQFDDDVDLIKPYWQQLISNMIDEHNINLLIIDNVSTAFNRDDNKQSDWQPAKQWLKRLRNTGNNGYGIAQILVMHAGKNGTIRGTSAIADTPDIIIKLEHPEDYEEEQGARFEIHWKKHRHLWGTDVKPFEAHLHFGKWECRDIAEAKAMKELSQFKQDILACISQGLTSIPEIALRLGKDPKQVSNKLIELISDGHVEKLARGSYVIKQAKPIEEV